MSTKEKLAQVLHEAGLFGMEQAARAGHYDDFEAESPTPIIDLVADLHKWGRDDLAIRAMNGEWDGTAEEARAWANRR